MGTRRAPPEAPPRPILYTAQDVADFCEVDLKTIHHWADAGKVPHHRTRGRHLRFRRNHVVRFLEAHGYPLPAPIAAARPILFLTASAGVPDDVARRLAPSFAVLRYPHAAAAIAHLVSGEPDVIVASLADPTWGPGTAAGLKGDPATSFAALVLVEDEPVKVDGIDVVVTRADLPRLPAELARALRVDRG